MTIHHFISIGVYSLQIGMSYSSKQGFYGDVPQVTLMGYSLMAPWLTRHVDGVNKFVTCGPSTVKLDGPVVVGDPFGDQE